MRESCDKCAFHYEREYGYFVGSIYLNYGPTAIVLTTLFFCVATFFGVGLDRQWPFLLTVAIALPIFLHRYARLFWLALDLRFNPPRTRDYRQAPADKQ